MQEQSTNAPTKELLSEVHRNLVMGSESLVDVLPKVQDKFLRREITFELEEYAAHTQKTVAMMNRYGVSPQKPGAIKTLLTKGGIALNTLIDSSDAHIADMIRRGTDVGVTQLNSTIDRLHHRGCAEPVLQLARDVVDFERTTVERVGDHCQPT